jgi:broad specificity phosphatase PhoE
MAALRRLFGYEDASDNLRIIITRHGERVDFKIGKNWLNEVRSGHQDPRIPPLTPRPNFEDWKYDSPLTINGESQSAQVGKKLLKLGLTIDYCYSSPAYRAVQTANKILESQGRKDVPINVEPGRRK